MSYAQQLLQWSKRRASIKKMLANGMKPAAIAERLKISRQRVYQIANGDRNGR